MQQASVTFNSSYSGAHGVTLSTNVREAVPDWISLDSVTTTASNLLHEVAAKVDIPVGHTLQVMGSGNFGISEMIGGVLGTYGKIFGRTANGGTTVYVKNGGSGSVPNDNSTFGALSTRYAVSPFKVKVYYFDGASQVADLSTSALTLSTLLRNAVGPVVEYKNTSASTQSIWVGSFDETNASGDSVHGHGDCVYLKLALTSFLESW